MAIPSLTRKKIHSFGVLFQILMFQSCSFVVSLPSALMNLASLSADSVGRSTCGMAGHTYNHTDCQFEKTGWNLIILPKMRCEVLITRVDSVLDARGREETSSGLESNT